MRAVGDAWSGGVHTSGTSLAQQRYVSAALVLGLGRLPVQLVSEELMPTLLQGVQHHLQSPSPPVRRLGMDVAEALSRVIDPDNPVCFDDEDEDDADDADAKLASPPAHAAAPAAAGSLAVAGSLAGGEGGERKQRRARRRRRRREAKAAAAADAGSSGSEEEADPLAPAPLAWRGRDAAEAAASPAEGGGGESGESGGEGASPAGRGGGASESDGSVSGSSGASLARGAGGESASSEAASSSDESLVAFGLADDRSDLAPTAAPRHLRELLAGLRAKEGEHELLAASLEGAAPLLRLAASAGRMGELRALAQPLCWTLLHLGNQYNLPRFGEWRRAALVALVSACAEELAAPLVGELYGTNHTLEMRQEALAVIRAVADELAAPPAARPPAAEAAARADRVAVQPVGVSRRTHSRPRPRPAAAASRLGVVAPAFFFPLMSRYDDPANTFRMLGEDCFLLEALLLTLAALLRGAAAYPCARPMARALCAFAWEMRHHAHPAVRRATLVALGAAAEALSAAVLLQELGGSLPDLQEWLQSVARDDVDPGCQQLAAACHSLLGAKVRAA